MSEHVIKTNLYIQNKGIPDVEERSGRIEKIEVHHIMIFVIRHLTDAECMTLTALV